MKITTQYRYVLMLLGGLCVMPIAFASSNKTVLIPELIEISPGTLAYRISGEFLKNGFPVDAPKTDIRFNRPLQIMKFQVSLKDYALCIADRACAPPFKPLNLTKDERPITGVSFVDAQNYAAWFTKKTGVVWRLPSDAEWAYSAGSRFFDDALGGKDDPNDPSERMLLKYQQQIDLDRDADPTIKPLGAHGANAHGLYDQSGNVWEWTTTCYKRSKVNERGEIISSETDNCGVRVVEGKHRSYMSDFIQDAKSGGCAVGTPPDYLGFRLVRDNPATFSIKSIRNWWVTLGSG